jgi:hypothetical protein
MTNLLNDSTLVELNTVEMEVIVGGNIFTKIANFIDQVVYTVRDFCDDGSLNMSVPFI